MKTSKPKGYQSLLKFSRSFLLIVFLSCCGGGASDESISSGETSDCRVYVLNVDILNSFVQSFEPDSDFSIEEFELQLFLSPTSRKLDTWDNLFGGLFLNLNRFGIPDNEELSDLVFAVQRQYVKARTVFTTTKTYGEIEPVFNSFITASNKLQTFCEENA